MWRINPTIISATEPPNTVLSLIAVLPVKKIAIKTIAAIIISSRPTFFSKLFMCVFYLIDYFYSKYKLKHNYLIKEIILGKKHENKEKL